MDGGHRLQGASPSVANVPLIDSTVCRFYGAANPTAIRQHLRQDIIDNKDWLDPLSGAFLVRREPMPLLRVADILIWMAARRRRQSGE